ncbi:DNA repair protein RAD51 homolog 3-like [Zophobas morio]|uniref:DNA repair protein RAD51 homolog 3-like n=1 Tax=Zophobas morio TaxID=2755281 RepID=UPI0030831B98
MFHGIQTIPLSDEDRFLLLSVGFRFAEEILRLQDLELFSKLLKCPLTKAKSILSELKEYFLRETFNKRITCRLYTLSHLKKKEKSLKPISTFISGLDRILYFHIEGSNELLGGVPRGCVTEIYGAPGTGKTQLAKQLCLSVSIPTELGGIGGEAIFVDTEGSFVVSRVAEQFEHMKVELLYSRGKLSDESSWTTYTLEKALSRIHFYRILSSKDLLEVVAKIKILCDQIPTTKLIVIDSIAFHFRCSPPDAMNLRNSRLGRLALDLANLAHQYELAVVVVNHVTTNVRTSDRSREGLTPALGDMWCHTSSVQISLQRFSSLMDGGNFQATLEKCPFLTKNYCLYKITERGLRDWNFKSSSTVEGSSQKKLKVDLKKDIDQKSKVIANDL